MKPDRPEQHQAQPRGVSKEHNLDVIKTADWVIDLGPGGGVNGGEIVVEGTPEDVAACGGSFTGQYLKPLLERSTPRAHPEPVEGRSSEQAGAQPTKKARRKASSTEDQPELIEAK